jgi:hypothetical protein
MGHICIAVKINDKSATFILDSGAEANYLFDAGAKRLAVHKDSAPPHITEGVGGTVTAWQTHVDSLEVGDFILKRPRLILMPFPELTTADGILGYEFLKHFVVTIDYKAKTLTLRDAAGAPPIADSLPNDNVLPFVLVDGSPCIDIDVDGVKGRFAIDTGNAGSLDISAPFVKRNHLREKYPKFLDNIGGFGIGGPTHSCLVRINSLTLGIVTLHNLPGYLSKQNTGALAQSDRAGLIGREILSRFKVILDYKRSRIILADADVKDRALVYNRSGLHFHKSSAFFVISDIDPDTPGAEAGINVGEEVIEVNGVSVIPGSNSALRPALFGAAGDAVRLKLRASDQSTREVIVRLRELL